MIASDLSDRSEIALKRAAELAVRLDSTLTVLHVVENVKSASSNGETKLRGNLEKALELFLDGRALEYQIFVKTGDFVASTNDVAQQTNAGILVVGARERRVFLDEFRETTLERLLRILKLPVLMAVTRDIRDYANILGAVGLSRNCAAAIRHGRKIAPAAKFTLFHAHEVSFRRASELDYADWKARSLLPPNLPDPIFVEASAEDAIHDLMEQNNYDLITVGANSGTSARQFFLGSLTSTLARKPPCDLLIARRSSEKR